jgi:hypothetical protein
MFVFDRNALAVLLPLALLAAVAAWSNLAPAAAPVAAQQAQQRPLAKDQAVAANLPSR